MKEASIPLDLNLINKNHIIFSIWNVLTTFGTGAIHFKQIGEVNNDIMLLN